MENLVTGTVADQGLPDETRLVAALPRNRSDGVVLEERTNGDARSAPRHQGSTSLSISPARSTALRRTTLERDSSSSKSIRIRPFFEIGGVLSAIQKHKWFEPFGSLEEMGSENTAIKRSRARAWIKLYDDVVKSGVTWAKVKHLGWTTLSAIAAVLDGENADHWIETALKSRSWCRSIWPGRLRRSAGSRGPCRSRPSSSTFTMSGKWKRSMLRSTRPKQ